MVGASRDEREEAARLRDHPCPLERPVAVLGGWRTPHISARALADRLCALTSGNRTDFVALSFLRASRVEEAAGRAAREIERAFGAGKDDRTREVDVVGVSMGGLVGRTVEAGLFGRWGERAKRVRVRRLFTLATPHRGARLARLAAPDGAARSMRPGSPFLERLDEALRASEMLVIPYARTRDGMVGATNAAPWGMDPLWLEGPRVMSHLTITQEWRFVIDVARRLRGEEGWVRSTGPAPRD